MNDLQNIFNQNIESFSGIFDAKKIAIAVSGGSDSLGLLMLADNWAKARQIKIIALTVDHQLRKESLEEAGYVAKICNERNIEHHILPWLREVDISPMHDSARKARYQLLTQYCLNNNIDNILTAHHIDDEIENFFIRLSKASGLLGLTSNNINYYNNVRILRPLFNVYKKQLTEYLTTNKIDFINDPSNQDPKYQRSNIRTWINSMPTELGPNLFKSRITQSLDHLKKSADEIKKLFIKELAERVIISANGSAIYEFKPHLNEIEILILSHLLTIIRGSEALPRAESVERLLQKLLSNKSCIATLHGCKVQKKEYKITIHRCFGKSPPFPIPLSRSIKWDDRWRCNIDNENVMISHLTTRDYIALKKDPNFVNLTKKVSQNILFTLPALFSLEKVVAIPHIAYYNDANFNDVFFVFEPEFTSRLIHFY